MSAAPGRFLRFSAAVADTSGRPVAFILALSLILIWGFSGPFFDFGGTWKMVMDISTTIITFLMVFLLQNAQNRDNRALQAKLDELIRASSADNRFVGAENLDDEELRKVAGHLLEKAGTRVDESPLDDEASRVEVTVDDVPVTDVTTEPEPEVEVTAA